MFTAALFTIAKIWNNLSVHQQVGKEDVLLTLTHTHTHTYTHTHTHPTGVLLSHEKE